MHNDIQSANAYLADYQPNKLGQLFYWYTVRKIMLLVSRDDLLPTLENLVKARIEGADKLFASDISVDATNATTAVYIPRVLLVLVE